MSAVKSTYNGKNTAAAVWGVKVRGAEYVYVCVCYTARGQVRYSSLFHEQGGWNERDS
jgi:hypothetical protein